jgi:phage gp46-like protein
VTDGVAASVTVSASWIRPNWLGVEIVIAQPDGSQAVLNFQWAWQGLA